MAVLNHNTVSLPWNYLNGEAQVEAANPSAQLTVANVGGRPLFKWYVGGADQYGGSTGVRVLGRVWFNCPKGKKHGFATRIQFPTGTVLDGWTLLLESHGGPVVVAPWRLIARQDGTNYKLLVAYNGGQVSGTAAAGWAPEQTIASITPGQLHDLACEFVWSDVNGEALNVVVVDGEEVHRSTKANAHKESSYVDGYVLFGLYMSTGNRPVTMYSDDVVWADTMAEAVAAMPPLTGEPPPPDPVPVPTPEPPPDPVPQPTPDLVVRVEELEAELAKLEAALKTASKPKSTFGSALRSSMGW